MVSTVKWKLNKNEQLVVLSEILRVNVFFNNLKFRETSGTFTISTNRCSLKINCFTSLVSSNFYKSNKQPELWKMLRTCTYSQSSDSRQWFNQPT
ncbi:unnamed protein product [Rotaria magnacalcarata]